MKEKTAIKLFHQACKAVMESDSKADFMSYAKSYANKGLEMQDPEYITYQIPYIQNNIKGWRGEEARMAKAKLKDVHKALKGK